MEKNPHASGFPPLLTATLDLRPVEGEPGVYHGVVPGREVEECTILVECSAADFPFESYCRFMRHEGGPYTFGSMKFAEHRPGIRVGPWPGWRGTPEFPQIAVMVGEEKRFAQPMFWGDEMSRGILRATATLSHVQPGEIRVSISAKELHPRRALVYTTRSIKALPQDTTLRRELAVVHPRLLITPDRIPELRQCSQSSHREFWNAIKALLDSWDLPFSKTPESKAPPGPQLLSDEDRVVIGAFLALLDPDHIKRALKSFQEYLERTRESNFEPLLIDTQAGETLFVLCLGYDWLYSHMTPELRQAARLRLWEVAEICFAHIGYERRDYAQAHFLGCGLGLLTFSILFRDEHPRATEWGDYLRGAFTCALRLLPPDGFYPHGINLWIYEFGFLLRWLEILRVSTGEDLWLQTPGLKEASAFRAATLSPDGMYGVTFGDPQYRVGGDSWCHYLIAARTGSAQAQGLGNRLKDLPHEGVDFRNVPARRRVYEFLFYEPTIMPASPQDGIQVFEDGGQVCARKGGTLFTIRSGSPIGDTRYRYGEYGAYGHSDPAQGSFLIFKDGTFVANGSGPVYRRDTSLHNVITIDGQGQVGDSSVWLSDFFPPGVLPPRPEVRRFGNNASLVMELGRSYLPHLGVRRCDRAVFVDPARCVCGVDIVECDQPRAIEWNTHSWKRLSPLEEKGILGFALPANTRLVFYECKHAKCSASMTDFVPAYPNDGTRDHHLSISFQGTKARCIWCYLLSDEPVPRLSGGVGMHLSFADGSTLIFDGRWLIPGGMLVHPD